MPKRKKVEEESEGEEESPPQKKTAREKREEAKARAREWAEREAKKAGTTITSPTRKRRTTTRKSTTPTRKATTPSRAAAAKKKQEDEEEDSPIKSPEPARKRQKLNSGKASATKKLTRKEEIAAQKARAKQWAEEQEQKKKAVAASPKRSPRRAAATKKSPPPPKESPAAAAAKKSDSDDEEEESPVKSPAPAPTASNKGNDLIAQAMAERKEKQQREAYNTYDLQQQQARAAAAAAYQQPLQQYLAQQQQQQAFHEQVMQQARLNAAYAQQQRQPYVGPYIGWSTPYAAMQQQVASPIASPQRRNLVNPAPPRAAAPTLGTNQSPMMQAQQPQLYPPAAAPTPSAAAQSKQEEEAVEEAPSPPSPTRRSRRSTAGKRKTTATTTTEKSPKKTTSTRKKKAAVKSPPTSTAAESTFATPQEEAGIEMDGDDVEVEGGKKKFWFLPHSFKFLLVPVIAAIVAYLYFAFLHPASLSSSSEALETIKLSEEQVVPPCFISYPREEEQLYQNCQGHPRPCPKGGRCSTGELISCNPSYMAVSPFKDQCVLSAATNETLAAVESLLAEWTIEHICSIAGCAHAVETSDDTSRRAPFFDVAQIKEEVPVSDAVLQLSDSFIVLSGSGETVIGFTDDYVDTKLIVPFWCYLGMLFFQFLELILSMLTYAGASIAGAALTVTMAYPLAAGATFLLLWGIYYIRKQRKKRAQLRLDVAEVRDLAYGKLAFDPSTDHLVIHLRDEVAMTLYPANKTKRNYIIKDVWPRVVQDVKSDNRVLKMTKMSRGTPRDAWQWTASTTPNSKK